MNFNISNLQHKARHFIKLLFSSWLKIVRYGWLSRFLPLRPVKLYVLFNSLNCKSNIWNHEQRNEITVGGLEKILGGHLFQKISKVHLICSELKRFSNLLEIIRIIIIQLPALQTVYFVTNAVDQERFLSQITALQDVLRPAQKVLHVEYYLNGVANTGDLQPDASGNFKSATRIIQVLKECNIQFSVHSILTPFNCYYADDMLSWLEAQGINDFIFSVAIEALPASNYGDRPQNTFSANHKFHLVGFFDQLGTKKTKDSKKRNYYQNLAKQLAYDSSRKTTSVWQANRVVLLETGGLLCYYPVCFFSLDVATNTLKLLKARQEIHHQIAADICVNSFCDSYGEIPPSEVIKLGLPLLTAPFKTGVRRVMKKVSYSRPTQKVYPARNDHPQNWHNVLITGWYGTETTGDKAILGELVYQLKAYQPGVKINLTTIDEKVSRQTNREMGYGDIQLVDIKKAHFPQILDTMDAVLIGGGPLMEVRQIEDIWRIFRRANQSRIARIIFGCGVGPIHSLERESFIGDICRLSTAGFFRDHPSYDYAVKLGGNPNLNIACDPSLGFLSRWRDSSALNNKDEKTLNIKGLLREQTKEYLTGLNRIELNARFVDNLSETFNKIIHHYPDAFIELMAMHMYWKGNDDRKFNRKVLEYVEPEGAVTMIRDYLDIYSHLERLHNADVSIAMRFHGHLFSLALGIPFLSIDYSGKNGKVGNLIHRINYQNYQEQFATFKAEIAAEKLSYLIENREQISQDLLRKSDELVAELKCIYVKMWGDPR